MKASDVIKWMQSYHPDEDLLITWTDRYQFSIEDNETGKRVVATQATWSDLIGAFADAEFMSEDEVRDMYDFVIEASQQEGKTEPAERVTVQ
jgi:hypothetical protein